MRETSGEKALAVDSLVDKILKLNGDQLETAIALAVHDIPKDKRIDLEEYINPWVATREESQMKVLQPVPGTQEWINPYLWPITLKVLCGECNEEMPLEPYIEPTKK